MDAKCSANAVKDFRKKKKKERAFWFLRRYEKGKFANLLYLILIVNQKVIKYKIMHKISFVKFSCTNFESASQILHKILFSRFNYLSPAILEENLPNFDSFNRISNYHW